MSVYCQQYTVFDCYILRNFFILSLVLFYSIYLFIYIVLEHSPYALHNKLDHIKSNAAQ